MRQSLKILSASCALLASVAAKCEDLAVSAAATFSLDTRGRPLVIAAPAELNLLEDKPVTYRDGETVVAVAPNGTQTVLTQGGGSSGTVAFRPTAGGLWRLETSKGEEAFVGVVWEVFSDGWTVETAEAASVRLETVKDGPDRKIPRRLVLPVAYSGDDWQGDLSKAATLAFTSPSGETTTLNPGSGNGAVAFQFAEAGRWTAVLTFADATSREAAIIITKPGLMISLH